LHVPRNTLRLPLAMAQQVTRDQKIRFMVWSAGMTGIIMVGTYLGATLKTERDVHVVRYRAPSFSRTPF
jgi:hypothetical protein